MKYAIQSFIGINELHYKHTDGNTWVYRDLKKVVRGGYARVPVAVRRYVAKWLAKNQLHNA